MHEHDSCEHTLKFCSKCDTVWCEKCRMEWGKHWQNWQYWPYYPYTVGTGGATTPYNPNTTGLAPTYSNAHIVMCSHN